MSKRKSRHAPVAKERQPQATRSEVAKIVAPATPPSSVVDFREEYRYVLSDLKRFGILAVAMFATLIVLALTLG